MQPGAELPFARLSFDFLRPVPLAPLTLTTRIVRPGRRVQELEAQLHATGPAREGQKEEEEGEVLVCRAHALRLVPAPEELPELALKVVQESEPPPLPGPSRGTR